MSTTTVTETDVQAFRTGYSAFPHIGRPQSERIEFALGAVFAERERRAAHRPLDQAPAADPALDALDWVERQAGCAVEWNDQWTGKLRDTTATIRDALADRITPAEARMIVEWGELVERRLAGKLAPGEYALIARLGKIAEAGR